MTPQQQNPKRLLRLKEASRYLSISPGKLGSVVQKGEIPIVKYGEYSPWLLDIRDLDAWVEHHKKTL